MKAKVQYNDFVGSVAADISDTIAANKGNYISSIGDYFNVDSNKFKVVGVSLTGIHNFEIVLICVDLERSTPLKDHVVKMKMDLDAEGQKKMLDLLFKRLNFVLFDSGEEKYSEANCDEVVNFEDFHQFDYDEN
ncbi:MULTISPECIES: hypothetical protein [Myroides]|uniref:Uncharacterized protein n=1 Tax=Myroides albus TaxID=2562892 RepID=A0A6I3LS70_9FLAO|nr:MULTISPECIES: hypothetical protein [Myroides]MTG98835.1 hypothetical protein [Myroides albus]MVX36665.1 hypothetical protein [Myroides sp. LoEW2-1]UVD80468.1 hypothetical protein NWE55_04140 [Myroides albus]